MVVGVVEMENNNTGSSLSKVLSQLSLDIPKTVSLDPATARVVGFDKAGTDLTVAFADGETLHIENFFVIGPDGDFSRLISPSGETIVTGLMGPESDGVMVGEPRDAADAGAQVASDTASLSFAAADSDGADWGGSALLAAAGISVGSGIGAFSGDGGSGGTPEAAPGADTDDDLFVQSDDADAELAALVAELTGGNPLLEQTQGYDIEALTADPDQPEQEPSAFEQDGENPVTDQGFVPDEGFAGKDAAVFHSVVTDESPLLDMLSDVTAEAY